MHERDESGQQFFSFLQCSNVGFTALHQNWPSRVAVEEHKAFVSCLYSDRQMLHARPQVLLESWGCEHGEMERASFPPPPPLPLSSHGR